MWISARCYNGNTFQVAVHNWARFVFKLFRNTLYKSHILRQLFICFAAGLNICGCVLVNLQPNHNSSQKRFLSSVGPKPFPDDACYQHLISSPWQGWLDTRGQKKYPIQKLPGSADLRKKDHSNQRPAFSPSCHELTRDREIRWLSLLTVFKLPYKIYINQKNKINNNNNKKINKTTKNMIIIF